MSILVVKGPKAAVTLDIPKAPVMCCRILENACLRAIRVMMLANPRDASSDPPRTSRMVRSGKSSYWPNKTTHSRRLAPRKDQRKSEDPMIGCRSCDRLAGEFFVSVYSRKETRQTTATAVKTLIVATERK